MSAQIDGGVGTTTIRVPAGVGVRVTVETGLGTTTVPAAYRQGGDVYVSPGDDTAVARVGLEGNLESAR